MAKKTNKPAVEAPVVDEAGAKAVVEMTKTINDGNKTSSMTQSDKVLYASILQQRRGELKTENAPESIINGFTMLEDATLLDVGLTEIVKGNSTIGLIVRGNEANYATFQALAAALHVKVPAFKSLPAPTKEQLKEAGITGIEPTNAKFLALEKKDVDAETIDKKKKEVALIEAAKTKDYLTDHTKIETDEQLKEALSFQLVNSKIISPLDRLITTAQFYRSYLEAHAEKAADPKAELAKIHEFTLADLLQDISTMVPPSFTAEGFGKLLCKRIADTQSVIPAFEMLKRCGKNRKTGAFRFSDEEVAAMVRVLAVWKASAQIASLSKDLKTLSKDAKKNAKAIEKANSDIAAEQKLMSLVTDPNFDLADDFISAYNNEENPLHKQAIEVAKSIVETHYKDVDIPELEEDSLLLNIQQHIGMDLNLFNNINLRRDDYNEGNLIEFSTEKKTEGASEEKKPEESKN